ncbi:F-actin-capping protein subunit alpha [Acyrthosiphon pisum]|uniref:F-actin-capping protein subunit alpha n=2 Tax=Acyrthosiphon pisum TaxID=7029 RepID=J9KA66_ACYPI|nr:F-actin-capping protein subunit alpha [Acyrthosiphon pisum]|eukprot:XP_001948270.1 PREDICTED: F-actin-capping protein subunit alpha-like [Acyrthosiphon pisum]
MAMEGEELISDQDKIKIVSDFILHSPPGEFNEVFNDVRGLVNNDALLKEGTCWAFALYNKEQTLPIKLENSEYPVLITQFNDLGSSRFYDPRSKQSFKFDHLRKEPSNYENWEPDSETETWRSVFETEFTSYTSLHYKHGTCSVFAKQEGSSTVITACIEDHEFQAKNFWNGRWRSQWTLTVGPTNIDVFGFLRIHVHYYENGNVQLVASKEIKESIALTTEELAVKEVLKIAEDAENEYQIAITENYQTMSETTFKALRRQLPVTRTKIDWNKIVSYSIAKEFKTQ